MDSVQKQLEELGLSQNEVKAYLAALELGAATAQQIAAKAAVVRPTAYVAIGGLVKRGLMSSHTRGKKQFFQAEKPAQLMWILEEEKKKLVERESKLKSLLPGLDALITTTGGKPKMDYYEGWEGLVILQNKLLNSGVKNFDLITYQAVASPKYNRLPAEKNINYALELKKRKIGIREVIVGPISLLKTFRPFVKNPKDKFKILPTKYFHSGGEIAIFKEFITLIVYLDKPYACLISNNDLAELLRIMFDGLWSSPKLKNLQVR